MKSILTTGKRVGYGYGRFSSKPQERGDSLRRQTEWIQSYADKHNISLLHTYFDEETSGKDGLNLEKEFGKLLQTIKAGQVLLVESQERLGRQNAFVLGSLIKDIVAKDVEIIFQDGLIVNKKNWDTLPIQFSIFTKGALGRYEIMERGRKVHESHVARLEGVFEHNKPSSHYGPCWITFDHKKECYVYDRKKMDIIKGIFDLAEKGLGLLKILARLNQDKVPVVSTRKKTNHWSRTTLNKLIHNKAVYGCFESSDGRLKENHYEPIVSKEVFYRVQNGLTNRRKKGAGRPSEFNNLYKGLLYCDCGSRFMLTRKHSHNRVNNYLVCNAGIEGKCIRPYESLRYDAFDESFRFFVLENRQIILNHFKPSKRTESKVSSIEGELQTITNRLNHFQQGLVDGSILPSVTVDKVILDLESKVKTLQTTLDLTKSQESTEAQLPSLLQSFFKCQSNTWIAGIPTPEWSNDLLKSFIEKVDVNLPKHTFTIHLKDKKQTTFTYPIHKAGTFDLPTED